MVKRIIFAVVILAIGITVVNDSGRWIVAKFNLSEATSESARIAAGAANANAAWEAASAYAETKGITIYGFEWTAEQASVWTSAEVNGTWVLSSVMVTFEGQPPTSTWVIRDKATEAQ